MSSILYTFMSLNYTVVLYGFDILYIPTPHTHTHTQIIIVTTTTTTTPVIVTTTTTPTPEAHDIDNIPFFHYLYLHTSH